MGVPCDQEDPFQGILERSKVAQALRDARASLARPSRPYTPGDRSLFRQSSNVDVSRPSSSYSIEQLRFEKDTFAASSESFLSTRSRLPSSKTGELCAPIQEELEEPELQLEDVGVFQECNDFLTEACLSRAGAPIVRCVEAEWSNDAAHARYETLPEEEYDAGAADDLALQMHVPPPGSDEESEDDQSEATGAHVTSAMDTGSPATSSKSARKRSQAAEGKPRPPGKSRASGNRPSKRKSSKGSLEHQESKAPSQALPAGLEELVVEFEAGAPASADAIAKLRGLVSDFKAGQVVGAPRLLRAVFALIDRQGADAPCLLRLGQSALELLGVPGVAEDVGSHGASAAYLNIVKALFKLSKDEGHDSLFKSEGLLDSLLAVLRLNTHSSLLDLRIFVVGTLKNVTNDGENPRYLTKKGALPILQTLMKPESLIGNGKEVQLLVQVTALLRNLAANSKRNQQLVELGILSDLTRLSAAYSTHEELQINISRVLSKLSLQDAPCEAFEADPSHMRQVVHSLSAHADASPLVLRLAFVLGNLTARSDRLREMFMFECDAAELLTNLVQRYWQRDRRLAQAESGLVQRGADAQDCESVLVKLVRLLANVAISPVIGKMVASCAAVIDVLLDIVGCKRMAESEELVLNAIAAVTNLLFYETETNLLFSMENKELLCRLLRPLLLESYNVEALVEAARALGNLSRHQDSRQWMSELRIDEILSILLAHYDRNLVFYACGALVNLAADVNHNGRLSGPQCGLRLKLAAVLRDAPADDSELKLVAVKVLLNLRLTGNEQACPWTRDEVIGVHESLRLVGKGVQADETAVHLEKLASRLDELLPQASEQVKVESANAGYPACSDLRPPLPYNRVPLAAAAG